MTVATRQLVDEGVVSIQGHAIPTVKQHSDKSVGIVPPWAGAEKKTVTSAKLPANVDDDLADIFLEAEPGGSQHLSLVAPPRRRLLKKGI